MKYRMQGLILAAGCGSRLRGYGRRKPKCLLTLGDLTLIEYQVDMLRNSGIQRVGIVVGCGSGEVRDVLGDRVEYIENSRFKETNSLYSLWLARHWIRGSFILMNCDVLVHPGIVVQIAETQGNVLTYDSLSGQEEEHMKVSFEGDYLARISKSLLDFQIQGENVGLLKFDREGSRALFSKADELVRAGGENRWAPSALDEIAAELPIRGMDIAGTPWTEIDFAEDLAYARQEIWPAIAGDFGASISLSKSYLPAGMRAV